VTDRAQHRRLHRVASAKRLGLESFAGQPLPIDRNAEQRRQRRQQTSPRGRTALPRALEIDHPNRATLNGKREPLPAAVRRHAALVELDLRALDLQGLSRLRRDPLQLGAHLPALEQRGCNLRKQRRLARLPPRTSRQFADHNRCHQEHSQREPVARIRQRERVQRRQKEEVERRHARDRDGNRVGQTPHDRHRQNGEDVEHAEAEHRHVRLQQFDCPSDRCEEGDADQPAAQPASKLGCFLQATEPTHR
jgi:hypothetical protein